MSEKGTLYLVATPIGNLEDISYRAVRILKEADAILAEDTRTSGVLLSHYDIHTPVSAYHEHNKRERLPELIKRLLGGQTLSLISDAGTPGISDPGEELVEACTAEKIPVYAVPGAMAGVCALISSGISSRRFAFEAFLPKKKKKRQQVLSELAAESRTIVLYEAPHHLKSTLKELYASLGERKIVLCRELTKRFEEKQQMMLSESERFFEEREPKGEYVVIIEGKTHEGVLPEESDRWGDITLLEQVEVYIRRGMDRSRALKRAADARGMRKREVYEILYKKDDMP